MIEKAELVISVFHEASLRSLELWTAGPREQAIERATLVLYSQVNADAQSSRRPAEIVRQYDLGISSRVKDLRSGKSTTRVDRILKGYLETLQA